MPVSLRKSWLAGDVVSVAREEMLEADDFGVFW